MKSQIFVYIFVFTVFTDLIPKLLTDVHGAPGYEFPGQLSQTAPLIVGGREAKPNEFTYQISLQIWSNNNNEWHHMCGGSIISEDTVLTAAHCIYRMNRLYLRVVAGEHNLSRVDGTEQISGIRTLTPHPNYNPETVDFDYGVLRLARNFTFNHAVKAIVLVTEDFQASGKCATHGWGNTLGNGSLLMPVVLNTVNLNVVPRATCSEMYEEVLPVTDRMICAGRAGIGGCHGDSGGPFVCNGSLAGVVSWGQFPCAQEQYPTVFANIAAAHAWIVVQ